MLPWAIWSFPWSTMSLGIKSICAWCFGTVSYYCYLWPVFSSISAYSFSLSCSFSITTLSTMPSVFFAFIPSLLFLFICFPFLTLNLQQLSLQISLYCRGILAFTKSPKQNNSVEYFYTLLISSGHIYCSRMQLCILKMTQRKFLQVASVMNLEIYFLALLLTVGRAAGRFAPPRREHPAA